MFGVIFFQWLRPARQRCRTERNRHSAPSAAVLWPTKSSWCSSWCCSYLPPCLGIWWLWLWWSGPSTSTPRRATSRRPSRLPILPWGYSWCLCPSTLRSISWWLSLHQSGLCTTRSQWVFTRATSSAQSSRGAPLSPSPPSFCWQLSGALQCWDPCTKTPLLPVKGRQSSSFSPG